MNDLPVDVGNGQPLVDQGDGATTQDRLTVSGRSLFSVNRSRVRSKRMNRTEI